MKKIIFLLIVSVFLATGYSVLAEESLPNPGTLPDSTFYFLKSWKESIQTFFTFRAENKAKQYLHLAEVRLAEYQKMIEKNKTEIAQKTLEKYEQQLNRALEKTEEAREKGKDVAELKEEISEKILKHQEILEGVLEKVPEEAKEGIERAIEASQKGFENAIQAVSGEKKEELERRAEEAKTKIEEKIIESKSAQSKPISSPTPNTSLPWVTGTLQLEFPSIFLAGQPIMMRPSGSPMPQPVAEQRPTLQSMDDNQWCAKKRMRVDDYGVKYILEMLGVVTVKVGSVDCRACYIRKFSEDGVLVAERWDDMYFWYLQKLSGKWACEKSINYKNFIGSEWTDYYQISESWSPKNFYYQCVKKEGAYVSGNADYCEKDVPAAAILPSPTPTPTEIRYYTCPDGTKVESGKLACPKPTPTEPPDYISCQKGGTQDHKCLDGTAVGWQCECLNIVPEATAYWAWKCVLEPTKFCPASDISVQPAITKIEIRHYGGGIQIFWNTNTPAISYIEYGLTTSYGSKAAGQTGTVPSSNHVVWVMGLETKLQPNTFTFYHFRIIATDAKGNTFTSQDYTFTTEYTWPKPETVCCLPQDGMCIFKSKEGCITMGGRVITASSCSPNPCKE